jgi:hypothetical protein
VLNVCERAVAANPKDWHILDSRRLARGIVGDVPGRLRILTKSSGMVIQPKSKSSGLIVSLPFRIVSHFHRRPWMPCASSTAYKPRRTDQMCKPALLWAFVVAFDRYDPGNRDLFRMQCAHR